MSSAQLDIHPDQELTPDPANALPSFELTHPDLKQTELAASRLNRTGQTSKDPSESGLKQQVAERVAAHRARRGQTTEAAAGQANSSPSAARPALSRSAHIAAAVAERYAHSQSYRAFLAAEAERAVHQADAAAQIATINAQAIAVAQQQLLADLENWDTPSQMPTGPVAIPTVPLSPVDYAALFGGDRTFSQPASPADSWSQQSLQTTPTSSHPASFTVRPYEDAAHPSAAHYSSTPSRSAADNTRNELQFDDDERLALDDEIAFRHNPIFEEASRQEPIPANLIEFPRQLIAARKARPRLAEGPLRDGDPTGTDESQLRIFEVEADQLSAAAATDLLAPEWSSILLSALPASDFLGAADVASFPTFVPQAAPVSLRVMAAAVDACLIFTVQVAFTAVFVLALTHLSGQHAAFEIPRTTAIAGTVATLAVLSVLYQLLFFTFSDATPGMRYARIGLCTFSDENPTRSAMRRRIFACMLAAFPLGFGIIWAVLDEDTLGWHDRISRMYQRAY